MCVLNFSRFLAVFFSVLSIADSQPFFEEKFVRSNFLVRIMVKKILIGVGYDARYCTGHYRSATVIVTSLDCVQGVTLIGQSTTWNWFAKSELWMQDVHSSIDGGTWYLMEKVALLPGFKRIAYIDTGLNDDKHPLAPGITTQESILLTATDTEIEHFVDTAVTAEIAGAAEKHFTSKGPYDQEKVMTGPVRLFTRDDLTIPTRRQPLTEFVNSEVGEYVTEGWAKWGGKIMHPHINLSDNIRNDFR